MKLCFLFRHLLCLLAMFRCSFSVLESADQTSLKLDINSTSVISSEMLSAILTGRQRMDRDAIYYLGLLYKYGLSMPRSISLALDNFKLAADLGHTEAQTACGVILLQNAELQNSEIAREYLVSAADANDAHAQLILAKHYLEINEHTRSTKSNSELNDALKYLHLATNAEWTRAEALHYLGVMSEYGIGTTQNFERAAEYYKLAVDLKSKESLYNLALMYAYGRGISQDFARAGSLFMTAAQANHAPSMYYLGIMRAYGYGVEIDYHKARDWFQKAVAADDERVLQRAAASLREIDGHLAQASEYTEGVGNLYPRVEIMDENGMPIG